MTVKWPILQVEADDFLFPAGIRGLADVSDTLHIAGEWKWMDHIPCAAIVGTRYASSWGRKTAFELGMRLAKRGWGVISGLAMGIDTAAHQGALAGQGRTGATLPGGLNHIYPPENLDLADAIVRGGGFLLSEYTAEAEPKPEFFAARDRLQSALSRAVIVVETEAEGGTMHTARFALEQGKPLFVFSPPANIQSRSDGNRMLLTWSGAIPVKDIDSLMSAISRLEDTSNSFSIE